MLMTCGLYWHGLRWKNCHLKWWYVWNFSFALLATLFGEIVASSEKKSCTRSGTFASRNCFCVRVRVDGAWIVWFPYPNSTSTPTPRTRWRMFVTSLENTVEVEAHSSFGRWSGPATRAPRGWQCRACRTGCQQKNAVAGGPRRVWRLERNIRG